MPSRFRNIFIGSQILWVGIAVVAFLFGKNNGSQTQNGDGSAIRFSTGVLENGHRFSSAPTSKAKVHTTVNGIPDAQDRPPTFDQMQTRMEAAITEVDPIRRMAAMSTLLAQLTPENIDAALAAFEGLESLDKSTRQSFESFLFAWGQMDGKAALEYSLNGQGNRKLAKKSGEDAAYGWATRDPNAARKFIAALEPGTQRDQLFSGVVRALIQSDLKAASSVTAEILNDKDRTISLRLISDELLKGEGVDGLKSWIAGIKDPAFQRSAMDVVAGKLARDDPEKALAFIEGSPDLKSKSSAISQVIDRWARSDPNEAAKWLINQNSDPALDAVVATFAQRVMDDDPAAALQWATTIQNEKSRARVVKQLRKEWLKSDKAEASAWLQESGLANPKKAKRSDKQKRPKEIRRQRPKNQR